MWVRVVMPAALTFEAGRRSEIGEGRAMEREMAVNTDKEARTAPEDWVISSQGHSLRASLARLSREGINEDDLVRDDYKEQARVPSFQG